MSRSEGFKDLRHPCQNWLQFRKGEWVRYDKEKKENIVCDLSRFLVQDDRMMRITGYNKPHDTGVMSNEVRTINDQLEVYLYLKGGAKQVLATGTYKEIGEKVTSQKIGGKYTVSLYISIEPELLKLKSEEKQVLANLALSGGALTGWIDFQKTISRHDFNNRALGITGYTEAQNGDVEYLIPNFEFVGKSTATENQEALKLDQILQEYLKEYLSKGGVVPEDIDAQRQAIAGEEVQEHPQEEEDNSFLDFKMRDGRKLGDCSIEDLEDLEIKCLEGEIDKKSKPFIALKKTLEYKRNQAKVSKPKKENLFGKAAALPVNDNEDDDIPF